MMWSIFLFILITSARIVASVALVESETDSFFKTKVSKFEMRTEDGEISFIRRKDVFKSEYSGKVKREGPKRQGFITMISHCSIENLHFVDSLAASWDGPISIAVFIDRHEVEFMRLVEYYHQCFKHIRAKTTFHLMYPESMALCFTKINCDAFGAKLKESPMYMRPLKGMSYPHNSLRNLATPTDGNGYVFHIDIDMIPSFNLHEEFLKYAETLDNRILESSIFIVPAFEYKHHTDDIPRTKLELIQRSVNREIRTFYSKACWKCQFNTNYRKWKYLKTKSMTTYDIETKFYNYEPYYIVRTDRFIPYDERFLGRGYDRISQVSEVWMAGFRFLVLTDSFLVHRGFHDLKKPRGVNCPIRKNKADEDRCSKKQQKDVFLQLVFEINEKRHFNRNQKEELRTEDAESKAWHLVNDPNRELYWYFVEELEKKYNGTSRRISQEWYFVDNTVKEHAQVDNSMSNR